MMNTYLLRWAARSQELRMIITLPTYDIWETCRKIAVPISTICGWYKQNIVPRRFLCVDDRASSSSRYASARHMTILSIGRQDICRPLAKWDAPLGSNYV